MRDGSLLCPSSVPCTCMQLGGDQNRAKTGLITFIRVARNKIPQGKHKLVQRGRSLGGIKMELASGLYQCLNMMRPEN